MKKNEKNIFYTNGLKTLCVVIFFIAAFLMSEHLILIKSSMAEGNPGPAGEQYYQDTEHCGNIVVDKVKDLSQIFQKGNIYYRDGENTLIDVAMGNAVHEEQNPYTTYYVKDIEEMIENGSIERLRRGLENARSADINNEYHYMHDDTYDVTDGKIHFSNEFMYLYDKSQMWETRLPISGVSVADYVLYQYTQGNVDEDTGAVYEAWGVSIRDIYSGLVQTADRLKEYKEEESQVELPSNIIFWVKDNNTGSIFSNAGSTDGNIIEDRDDILNNGSYGAILRIVRENGVVREKQTEKSTRCIKVVQKYMEKHPLTGKNEEVILAVDFMMPVEDQISWYKMEYDKNRVHMFYMLLCICLIILMAAALGVLCVKNDQIHKTWMDRTAVEILLAGMVLVIILVVSWISAETSVWMDRAQNSFTQDIYIMSLYGVFLSMLLSCVRRIRCGNLWESSLLYTITMTIQKVSGAKKTTIRLIVCFILIFLGNFIFIKYFSVEGVVMAGLVDSVMLLYILREHAGRKVIFYGLGRIASGELDYQIDTKHLIGETRKMAEAVNHVGDGLARAVQETVKSERLKADLITNVSHDIKTPLTSIINYVDLIKREHIQNDKVSDYIEILDHKSQRLKQLTEDLVEASKISSGNIVLHMQPIGLAELVLQTNGEFEEKFAQKQLGMVCDITGETLYVLADGRRMWRVLENLYNNTAKYALEGTDVYITVKKEGTNAVFEMINVSFAKINVNPEELKRRFVRGDESRSTEGSGLGLSIAGNLVKMQQGVFEINTDGGLFKVTIKFPIWKDTKKEGNPE